MDFPIFHLDFFGNRMLVAVIAIVHVMINHPLAVGAVALVATLEWVGRRTGEREWDELARRILFVSFIVTTTLGALTGVGIWLATALTNPYAIGSLLRVFFWAWFTEWLVFVSEVVLIMIYYLTWKRWSATGKGLHNAFGFALALFSWATMAIIVAILGFMMDPGNWMTKHSLFQGFFNPVYLPQLAFRTPLAMAGAGLYGLFLAYFFTEKGTLFRDRAVRFVSIWVFAWSVPLTAGALWYLSTVPDTMLRNVKVAITTQAFIAWFDKALGTMAMAVGAILLISAVGLLLPRRMPRWAMIVPFVLMLGLLGTFERTREFVRKPWVIGEYMYANGFRAEDYPLLQEKGMLGFAAYTVEHHVDQDNRIAAGRDVFRLACTRCHTTTGVNSIVTKLERLYPEGIERAALKGYLGSMHTARPYMPPFPGSDRELGALADYLIDLRVHPRPLPGAQRAGAENQPTL